MNQRGYSTVLIGKNCNTVSIFYASVGLLESLSLPYEWSRPKSVLHILNILYILSSCHGDIIL